MKTYGAIGEAVPEYRCRRIVDPSVIDGNIEKPCWRNSEWTPLFRDMVTGAPAALETRGALLWDNRALYVAFNICEPDIRASLTERDSFVWLENDVEFFIGGKDCYYEFEINALGTIYEAFYIWKDAYTHDSRFASAREFDLIDRHVDILGGFQDAFDHPRGTRWCFRDWDFPGLQVAVSHVGTINDPSDIDTGWAVEMALPWDGMKWFADGKNLPPREGDVWHLNLFRFQTFEHNGRKIEPGAGWAWSKHGAYDSHIPECFGRVVLEE